VAAGAAGVITPLQGDVRELDLGENSSDIIMAAAVLHHLRTDDEWRQVFAKFYRALRPGGSLWVSDLITHARPAVQQLMWARYGDYLSALKGGGAAGAAYREQVFDYIDQEDSPRPLMYAFGGCKT
jgi:tRNA (cmo5U34)-methyltransferase